MELSLASRIQHGPPAVAGWSIDRASISKVHPHFPNQPPEGGTSHPMQPVLGKTVGPMNKPSSLTIIANGFTQLWFKNGRALPLLWAKSSSSSGKSQMDHTWLFFSFFFPSACFQSLYLWCDKHRFCTFAFMAEQNAAVRTHVGLASSLNHAQLGCVVFGITLKVFLTGETPNRWKMKEILFRLLQPAEPYPWGASGSFSAAFQGAVAGSYTRNRTAELEPELWYEMATKTAVT